MTKVSAYTIEEKVEDLVKQAIKYKTFYHYNKAYAEILDIDETEKQAELLNTLSTVSSEAYKPDIIKINKLLIDLVKNKDAKLYDELAEIIIPNADIPQIDKDYLSSELFSWGQKLIWTGSYSNARTKALVRIYDLPNISTGKIDIKDSYGVLTELFNNEEIKFQKDLKGLLLVNDIFSSFESLNEINKNYMIELFEASLNKVYIGWYEKEILPYEEKVKENINPKELYENYKKILKEYPNILNPIYK
jgi:hypothetical protein